MSLEAVVLQHLQSSHGSRETRNEGELDKIHDFPYELVFDRPGPSEEDALPSTTLPNAASSSSSNWTRDESTVSVPDHCMRRRRKKKKRRDGGEEVDAEEVERQRKKHIQVERNRRKQMNNCLAHLRSLMPPSYSLRGDQASIVGGAIIFVKELEQLLQYLQSHHKRSKLPHHHQSAGSDTPSLFSDFFSFPQYSTLTTTTTTTTAINSEEPPAEAVADVEVTAVEQHVTVRVLSRKQPKQLIRVLLELASAHLTVLHLNVTSIDAFVLYSFSLKKEDECQLNTVKEIATAVYDMIRRIQRHAELIQPC